MRSDAFTKILEIFQLFLVLEDGDPRLIDDGFKISRSSRKDDPDGWQRGHFAWLHASVTFYSKLEASAAFRLAFIAFDASYPVDN